MKTFEAGKTYTMRSPGDHDCVWTYTVTKRTPKTITITDGKETKTCRVNAKTSELFNAESIYPLGHYSMCPILFANAEDVPEETEADEVQEDFLDWDPAEVREALANSDKSRFDKMLGLVEQEEPTAAEDAHDSKLNPMCEKCANYPTDCAGTHEQVWTGCVHRETAPDENRTFAPKKLRTLTDDQLLTAWEFTEHLEDPQCPTIRGWLMDEIERRYPERFNAWLDQDAPEDSQLRHYVMGRG